MSVEELTALFRKLGASDPDGWARSQVSEGIDQLARKRVVPPEDTSWIDAWIASSQKRPEGPGAGAGPALQRMLAAGADRQDIHEIVRVMQWELLSSFCYLLEDPGDLEPEIADMAWQLVRTNDGECLGAIGGLHESVLETDPAGREMSPTQW